MRARIVIVGGGVIGLWTALQAARRTDPLREPVMLLERARAGAGSSGRSGAVLRQLYASTALAGMARDSLRAWSGFARETGRSVGFLGCGVLWLAPPGAAGRAALAAAVERLSGIGIEIRLVAAPELRALAPGIAVDDDAVGAFEPQAGVADPARALDALAAVARDAGAAVREGTPALGLVLDGDRAVGVETADGTVECEQVVVACGPWTGPFLARHGVELPLCASRVEQHFVAAPEAPRGPGEDLSDLEATAWVLDGAPPGDRYASGVEAAEREPPVAHPVLLDLGRKVYARCEPGRGRTRVGRLDHEGETPLDDPDRLDERCGPEFGRWARARLEGRFPVYAGLPDVGTEAALYTMTPDGQALLGAVPGVEGLYVASGFSGHGFKLAPSVGLGLAQLLTGQPVSAFEPGLFAPGRFAAGAAPSAVQPFGF